MKSKWLRLNVTKMIISSEKAKKVCKEEKFPFPISEKRYRQ